MFSKFNNFEVCACIEDFSNGIGDIIVHAVPCPGPNDTISYWTVYGHLPQGGVEALADCPDQATAEYMAAALKKVYLPAETVKETFTSGPDSVSTEDCHILTIFGEEFASDADGNLGQSLILERIYAKATPAEKETIDSIFIALCGWSFETLFNNAHKRNSLPKECLIPKDVVQKSRKDDVAIADYLSDRFGYCINTLNTEKRGKEIFAINIDWDLSNN